MWPLCPRRSYVHRKRRSPPKKISAGGGAAPPGATKRKDRCHSGWLSHEEPNLDGNVSHKTRTRDRRRTHAQADCDVRWCEEPVSSDDLDGLREVRDAISSDVTAGEYGY